jgi:L-ascorbate metabolism protein UlaG (beta-lactamase superfamily)
MQAARIDWGEMRRRTMAPTKFAALAMASMMLTLLGTTAFAQSEKLSQEPACQTLQPASTGGPLPKSPNVLVLRYLGRANYEVDYRGKVLLLDAYYDNSRPPFGEPFGTKESDITKADAILVGHTHGDHFVDAPAIAKRTGAPVLLAPPGVKYLQSQGVAEKQIVIVRGGENLKQPGYTVQTALGIHMPVAPDDLAAYREFTAKTDPLTEEQSQQLAAWRKSAPVASVQDFSDPENDTIYHGSIVYVITFDGGYRLLYSDTAGVLSGGEKVLADSIHAAGGKIDLGILGYLDSGFSVPLAIKRTVTRARVWQPAVLLPSHHHDGEKDELPDMPTAPLFEALRDQLPKTRSVSLLYRAAVCVNTRTNELFVGNYAR